MSFGWVGKVIGNEFGRFWRSIAQGAKLFYDYLGLSVMVSAFWYALAFVPVQYFVELARVAPHIYTLGAVVLVTVLWAAPVTASAYAAMASLINRDGFYIRDLFAGIGRYWKKTVASAAIALFLLFALVANVWFYFNSPYAILRWLTVLFGYLMAFWFMGIQYLFPFIVQQDVGIFKTLKRTALVALDNVIVSFVLFVVGVIFTAVSLVPLVPMVLVFMGLMAAIHNYALIEILKKYDDPLPQETSDSKE